MSNFKANIVPMYIKVSYPPEIAQRPKTVLAHLRRKPHNEQNLSKPSYASVKYSAVN